MSAEQNRRQQDLPSISYNLQEPIDRRTAIKLISGVSATIGTIATLNAGASIQHLTEGFPTDQEVDHILTDYAERTGETPKDPGYQDLHSDLEEKQEDNRRSAEINAAISIPIATAGLGAAIGGAVILFRTRGNRLEQENS